MSLNKKVIITDYLHPYLNEKLLEAGFETDVLPDISNQELQEVIHKYMGLVLSTKIIVNNTLIDKATHLKFIARAGSGLDNINVAYAKSKNIHVISSPEGNANAVGEHAVGMLLALVNKICKADRDIRNGIWQREENRGIELEGKTIGIIGYGHTGASFAKKLTGFDIEIMAYDKFKSGFGNDRIKEATLDEIKTFSDIISFHVPLTPETHHMCNEKFIQACNKSFYLINTSRGKAVNIEDTLSALESGKIRGAALDVFENEQFYVLEGNDKIYMNKLQEMSNVVLTPHVAGWTQESFYKIAQTLYDKIALIFKDNKF